MSPCALGAADWVQISSDYESSIYYDRGSLKRDADLMASILGIGRAIVAVMLS